MAASRKSPGWSGQARLGAHPSAQKARDAGAVAELPLPCSTKDTQQSLIGFRGRSVSLALLALAPASTKDGKESRGKKEKEMD